MLVPQGGGFSFNCSSSSFSTSIGGIWWLSWARLAHVINPISYKQPCPLYYKVLFRHWQQLGNKEKKGGLINKSVVSIPISYKFSLKHLCLKVIVITRIVFYIKIEVRSSLIFFTCIFSIIVTALKIRDILIYFSVPFILYIVCRPISSFTIYKALFALIAVLTVRGVVLLVREVVSLISIE